MKITDKHISFIEDSLTLYGVKDKALREDLVDHICTYIEEQELDDFNKMYQKALQKFGGYASFQNLQLETSYQKISKQIITINKLKFSFGFLVILLLVMSLVFQIMDWPYANAWLLGAITLSVMVILPIHLYSKYKLSIHKFS